MNYFEYDPYPENLKILFIGLGYSTHTHSWINLLSEANLNVRLFSVPGGGTPPSDWKTRTYVCSPSFQLPEGLDPATRHSLYPLPEEVELFEKQLEEWNSTLEKRKIELEQRRIALERNVIFKLALLIKAMLNLLGKRLGIPPLYYDYSRDTDFDLNPPYPSQPKASSAEEWLAQIIEDWRPDIIHTLGLFDGQGGEFYFDARKRFGLERIGKWVLQLRGGSDLALNHFIPEMTSRIAEIVKECTHIISDNTENIRYLREMNIQDEHFSSLIPVPGTGGIDVESLSSLRATKSSQSRDIVFPKGYELAWSKCLPVFEAFQLCWERIAPCKIHILNVTPEVRAWFYTLPSSIRESCIIHDRIPRQDFFSLLANARVLLIPSLVDGVPNSMYEAMAVGTFPIVSPLKTICSVVEAEKNVLFARNLYPQEIADALTLAMTDDRLIDIAAKNNFDLVKKVADRSIIQERVIKYYEELADHTQKKEDKDLPLVTVITPSYNRALFLDETVNSILSQDYSNIEYIVLDDGSKDNTKEVMEKYRGRLIFESHDNIGETRTVNRGFKMAEGEFICVVNSDDPLLPGAITSLVDAIQCDPETLVAYPDWVEIDPDSKPIREMHLPDYDIRSMLKIFNVAMGPGSLFKRSVLDQFGYRDPHRRYTGDLEFWFRLASHGKLVHVSKVLATHRTHPQSASVSEKSSVMAAELISLVRSLFKEKHLPVDLLAQRKKILAQVYYVSSFYCPDEPLKKVVYRVLAFVYDPRMNIRRRIQEILSWVVSAGVFVLRSIKYLLKIILPEPAYLRFLSWWMRLTGQK